MVVASIIEDDISDITHINIVKGNIIDGQNNSKGISHIGIRLKFKS